MFTHDVQTNLEGYVVLCEDTYSRGGIAFGGYARDDPTALARHHPNAVVVNVERARQVAREFHGWDIPSEDEIRQAAMAGR